MNELFENVPSFSYDAFVNEVMIASDSLHFIRADWFYAFIPLIIYLIFSTKKALGTKNWKNTIDAQLLPFVLTKTGSKQRRYPILLVFIAASLCITALAGPVYKKLPQPVYREQSSLVILLDLSQSMNANDIKPSRLSRSKLELLDILKSRKSGQTALIVYAADAFVVTPLTDDNSTIANLVPALETSMMPAQGSNLSNALVKTFSLFTQAGIIKGDILVITDDIHPRDIKSIQKVSSQGHRLSVFGIGTIGGAPIPLDETLGGGFLQNSNGAIVIPKLDPIKLQNYALTGSGIYSSLLANDDDIIKLSKLFESKEIAQESTRQDTSADIWQEEGHWLLLPLMFFAALWMRKGWLTAVLPFTFIYFLTTPNPAYADTIDLNNLWSSPDQKAMKAFNKGDNEHASKTFAHPEWKASAQYRSGDYESVTKTLDGIEHSDAYYNKANALAKLGKYQESVKAYDQSLELDENNEDAKHNRELVKQALEQQQKENPQQEDSSEDSKQDEESQDSDEQYSDSQSDKENAQSESEDESKQQESEQQSDKQQAEQQEDEQLKQRDAKKEQEQEKKEKQEFEDSQKESEEIENKDSDEKPAEIETNPTEASITEEEKATEQWLKRIPDDPGGLLRRKFLYQYQQIPNQKSDSEPW